MAHVRERSKSRNNVARYVQIAIYLGVAAMLIYAAIRGGFAEWWTGVVFLFLAAGAIRAAYSLWDKRNERAELEALEELPAEIRFDILAELEPDTVRALPRERLVQLLSGLPGDLVRQLPTPVLEALPDEFRPPPAEQEREAPRTDPEGEWSDEDAPVAIESIQIRNVKSLSQLELDLARESTLEGNWTCVAGINGAGKSSILQATCLALLGPDLTRELGQTRLSSFCRRTRSGEVLEAEVVLRVRQGERSQDLVLPLTREGLDYDRLASDERFSDMRRLWKAVHGNVLAAYGASRNLSSFRDTRHASLHPVVRRQMTLFDPLSQIADVDVLLDAGPKSADAVTTLRNLLRIILQDEDLEVRVRDRKVAFMQHGTRVDAVELPDGFRSTVAWLADLCSAWHAESGRSTDPRDMRGIVLLDEIGLHLHPELQRTLVPRIREALPRVQFIVSTHSPMVLACFDRAELVILDASAENNVRQLDRQVFGMSMDDIYEWLMGTLPESGVMEEMLEDEKNQELAVYLYQSADVNEEEARELIDKRRRLMERLQEKKGK